MVRLTERAAHLRVVQMLVLAFGAVISTFGRAQEPKLAADLPTEEQKSLLAEYRRNYDRQKEFYGNARMVVIRRESNIPAYRDGKNPDGRRTVEFVYRARDGKFLRLDETILDIRDESRRGATTVWGARPEGHLVAKREAPDRPFVPMTWSLARGEFEWAPYFNFVGTAQRQVFERIQGAKGQVVEINAAQEDGERVATVTVRAIFDNGDTSTRLVLYRDRAWAVKEATWGDPNLRKPGDSVRRCQCEYKGERDGIPLLTRVVSWMEVGPERRRVNIQEAEIRDLQVGAVAEEEFTLEALGLGSDGQPATSQTHERFRYPVGQHGKGELRYIRGVPVLIVRGTHAEMGEQIGHLALKPARKIVDLVKDYAKRQIPEGLRPITDMAVQAMYAKFPAEYRQELEAMAAAADVDKSTLMLANTIVDLQEIIGCSSLLVDQKRSTTGGPLYGRNLDVPYVAGLAEYSLLVICRPDGRHAFAMPNLPGFLMFFSGMNSRGVALGSQSVGAPGDGSGRFDPAGVPSCVAGRRLMEGCGNLDEIQAWLEQNRLMRCVSIAACDPHRQAVFEVTTKRVLSRDATDGVCCATNHFRRPELAGDAKCWRYSRLEESRKMAHLGVMDVASLMKATHQGKMTIHTMIFEPASLRIHLAMGPGPATDYPRVAIDLAELLYAGSGDKMGSPLGGW